MFPRFTAKGVLERNIKITLVVLGVYGAKAIVRISKVMARAGRGLEAAGGLHSKATSWPTNDGVLIISV